MALSSVEFCSGAGGQALGLERSGFGHEATVEDDRWCCETLRANRPGWNTLEMDLRLFRGDSYRGADLVAAGLPCPPFSIAGKQLGEDDDRNLFPAALAAISEIRPRAVMIENVRGFGSSRFDSYREWVERRLAKLGFATVSRTLNANEFGVPQLRPRFILLGLKKADLSRFSWPRGNGQFKPIGAVLRELMASNGWSGAGDWAKRANDIAPTLVGGSKKHGGPDLGPTRARRAWAELAVDGLGIADEPPGPDFPSDAHPRLTVAMAARIQEFPDDWIFMGGKTAAYRQVGNAFPPPVAEAIGRSLAESMGAGDSGRVAV